MNTTSRSEFLEKRALTRELRLADPSPAIVNNKLRALTGLAKTIVKELEELKPKSELLAGRERIDLNEELARYEMSLIRFALIRSKGRQALAAKLLNVKPTTLNCKMKKYGMLPESQKKAQLNGCENTPSNGKELDRDFSVALD